MRGVSSNPYACSGLAYKQQTDKIADIIRIKCKIKNFKKFYSLNRIFDLGFVFTVGLVAMRSSELNPILICFDEKKFGPKSYPPHNTWVTQVLVCNLPTLWTISFVLKLDPTIFCYFLSFWVLKLPSSFVSELSFWDGKYIMDNG